MTSGAAGQRLGSKDLADRRQWSPPGTKKKEAEAWQEIDGAIQNWRGL